MPARASCPLRGQHASRTQSAWRPICIALYGGGRRENVVRTLLRRLGLCASIVAMGWPAGAGQPLAARVVTNAGIAPCDIVIQVFIESDAHNRAVKIEIESETFYTSSTADLEGAQAPRTKQVRFRMLPAGSYDVRVTLIGNEGARGFYASEVELW